jgi:anti-sigma-K factor RskA
MIDEEKQDQLIAHLLDPGAGRGLDAEIAADAELARLTDELRETLGALAHAAPLQKPPPRLRSRVLAAARGEATAPAFITPSKPKPSHTPARVPHWLPWAIAAGMAAAAIVQFAGSERFRAEAERLRAEAGHSQREAETHRARNAVLEAQAGSLTAQSALLQQQLDTFKKRDALAEVRIATLSAQVNALTRASAVIVWDADQQRGVIKLANLPKADSGKDYQLWVIDPKYNAPVSAGVITVGSGGTAYVSFSPEKPISAANKFAISLERAGGSPTPTQVIFIGD